MYGMCQIRSERPEGRYRPKEKALSPTNLICLTELVNTILGYFWQGHLSGFRAIQFRHSGDRKSRLLGLNMQKKRDSAIGVGIINWKIRESGAWIAQPQPLFPTAKVPIESESCSVTVCAATDTWPALCAI